MKMKKTIKLLAAFLFVATTGFASPDKDTVIVEKDIKLTTGTGVIFGTLATPEKFDKIPVALIIAGSGPTDRDGNNQAMKNNSLKMLATGLAKNGIASVRYDKRAIAESMAAGKNEIDLRFDDYVNDASGWLKLLKEDSRFSKVIVIGHSEGSLIGMVIAQSADKYVSIAGAGQSADKILKTQLQAQPQAIKDIAFPVIDSLVLGKTVDNVNPMLNSLFRSSVQPYLISWFKYDPSAEIKKLKIPVLVVQGANDIQVSVDDAKRLSEANKAAKLVIIDKMNHVFKLVDGDRQANIAAYNDPSLPISEELVKGIVDFILAK
jgi:uncharacterized protein